MPTVFQFRRGTSTQNDAFTGAIGELTVDTTNDSIRVHDGATAGGFEVNAKNAQYADVAERYWADEVYEPGTLLVFGGDKEVTASTQANDTRIAGIVSTDPYCVMNSPHRQPELTNEYHPPIALLGRVPAKVVGQVKAGDLMVSSDTLGYARSWTGEGNPPMGSVVGKAVTSKPTDDAGTIEIAVGVR